MPISLVIIDLDYFKLLNNSYEHQVGDDCLESVERILSGFLKSPGDISARYGGEVSSIT